MDSLLSKTEEALIKIARDMGEAAFRGKQLYQAIYRRRVVDFAKITEISKSLQDRLGAAYRIADTQIAHVFHSEDATRRYLLQLADGSEVEAVFIPEEHRDTICISCQVGCAVGCTFCMTAQLRIKRSMTAGEISWVRPVDKAEYPIETAVVSAPFRPAKSALGLPRT
jgi:23S rRNA (adenine2503-C2)-methyltransferase